MNSRKLNFLMILVGGAVALYAESGEEQNTYILIGGIFLLMIGLYRLSRGIPSRNEQSNGDTPVNEE
ncbi:hypothetical protein U0L90_11935 [Flavobacteriaceae sp. LMIT009]